MMGDPDATALAARAGAWCRLLVGAMLVSLLALLGRVVYLKVRPPAALLAVRAPVSSLSDPGRRGNIYDARHRLIATSTIAWRLFVDPVAADDPATVAVDIAEKTGLAPDEMDRRILRRASPRYAVVCDRLEPHQAAAIRAAGIGGVGLEPYLLRNYPCGELGAAVVGLVGAEHHGLAGSEHAFDALLAHRDGRVTYLRDAARRPLWTRPDGFIPPRDGRDVCLTIDLAVQETVERRLRRAVVEYGAAGGRAVVVRPRTGEILAMADVAASTEEPPALRRNRCATDPYEPGSTFKPFVWAAAVELGRAHPEEIIPTPAEGPHRTSQGRLIRDTHALGPVPFRTVLARSLNSGMAIVSERLSARELRAAIGRFGFGRRTGCGVPGETAGILTSHGDWSHYTQTSVAMGHEIGVTALQMVRAFCAFARDGTMPTLRLRVEPADDYRFEERACTAAVAAAVRQALCEAIREGTGARAASRRHTMFGKSGTAQLPRPEGGGYFQDRYVSSFIAAAPAEEPRVVVLVVIDDPDRALGHWGSEVAGPAVRDIVDAALELCP